jgi:hypothetical protein
MARCRQPGARRSVERELLASLNLEALQLLDHILAGSFRADLRIDV